MLFREQTLPESAQIDSDTAVSRSAEAIPIRDKKDKSGNEACPNRLLIGRPSKSSFCQGDFGRWGHDNKMGLLWREYCETLVTRQQTDRAETGTQPDPSGCWISLCICFACAKQSQLLLSTGCELG